MKQKILLVLIFAVQITIGQTTTRKFGMGPEYKKEIDSLTLLIKKSPDSASYYYERSFRIFLFNLQNPQQKVSFKIPDAYKDINKAILLKPNDSKYYSKRAEFYGSQDSLKQAISDFTKSIELSPTNGDLYGKRADIYTQNKEYDKACADYKKGKELGDKKCKNIIAIGFNGCK